MVASWHAQVKVWATSSDGEWTCVSTVLHPNKTTSVAWTAPVPDDAEEDAAVCSSVLGMGSDVRLRLATGCIDSHTRVWRWPEAKAEAAAEAQCEAALGGGKATVSGVAWSPDGGPFLAAGWGAGEDTLVVWAAPPTRSPSQLAKLASPQPSPDRRRPEEEAEPARLPITIPTLSLEDVGVAELGFNELRCVPNDSPSCGSERVHCRMRCLRLPL